MQLLLYHILLLLLHSSVSMSSTVSSMSSDGVALLSLLNHWTSVPNSMSSSWNASDSTPCKWVGIECDTGHNVVSLNLSACGISGQLGPEIGSLSHLHTLYLNSNKFSGKLPPNICYGKQLRVLDMGFNRFEGSIPSGVGSCSSLTRLNLEHNNLTGVLPQFAKNPNLAYIDISNNEISGGIPSSLGNCSNLTAIDLSMNKLTGVIPQELGNLAELRTLILFQNNLVGPLPSHLSNCSKMYWFDVGSNLLNGSIPSSLRSWRRLSTLILRDNRFTGGIPPFLSELEKLSELQLGGNLLGGVIPSSIGELQSTFYSLNLSSNALTGQIPLELRKLIRLEGLDISHNNLTGTLKALDEMQSLVEVNVSYNNFTGSLPNTLMHLLNSSSLSLVGNPYLYVNYLPSCGLTCAGSNISKPYESQVTNQKQMRKAPIVITFFLTFLIICCLFILLALWRRWRLNRQEGSSLLYKVMEATEHFNDQYIVGRGAHGTVYKASLHPYGDFAVKRIVFTGHEGRRLTMVREIETIGKIRHRNLVNFVDFWFRQGYGLILYGYMENGSLHDVLHGINPPPTLEWSVRYKIALGTAYGLAYIHHNCDPPILHRDIKPSNILLDSEMEAHVADFGVAKFLDQSSTSTTPISVVGTIGYIAPENIYRAANSTEKSDLYSYGVVLLELITRKKALDPSFMEQTDLVGWVSSMWSNAEEIDRIVDSSLVEELRDFNIMKQVVVVLQVALRCTDKDPSKRPMMRDVVEQLLDADPKRGTSIARQDVEFIARERPSFLLKKVMEATENFNDQYIIGRGAHGTVYKASLPYRDLAVKKVAFAEDGGGRLSMVRETQILGNIRHRNLVKLEDFWFRKDNGLMLYRYMENGNLHDVLHKINPPPTLEWIVRYKIALGTANALAYLHYDCDPPIVHRDIKPMNILLDSEMEPHVADFGIAKLLDPFSTSMSTSVIGTLGYIAPETVFIEPKSEKYDVYSYGVVLLELITRKKALDSSFMEQTDLVGWVTSMWSNAEEIDRIVDSSLMEELRASNIMEKVVHLLEVALLCTSNYPSARPTMRYVVNFLLSIK